MNINRRILKIALALTERSVHPTETMQPQPLPPFPQTMRAAQGKNYGDIDEMLTVEVGVPTPRLADIPEKARKNWAIVRTLAVSLAPGDCRVLSGKTSPLQGPPSFPYIPGGDLCGVVHELPKDAPPDLPFQVGDIVAVMFHEAPRGGLADYAAVNTVLCDKVPEGVSHEGAAALGSSGPVAVGLADYIQKGDRVLILGAGGGVGSHLCQLARHRGASFVAGVAKDARRLLEAPLSVDEAIDYTKQDPYSLKKWIENPFDIIIDLSSGGWRRVIGGSKSSGKSSERKGLIVKPAKDGGRFLTITPDDPMFEAHTMWQILKIFALPAIKRAIRTRTFSRSRLPKYSMAMALPSKRTNLSRALKLAGEGKLVPCTNSQHLFPFTTEGVCKAFRLQESRHVKGKVVIKVADM